MSADRTPLTYFHKQYPGRLSSAWRLTQAALAKEANTYASVFSPAIGRIKRMANRHRVQERCVDRSANCTLMDEIGPTLPCTDTPDHLVRNHLIGDARKKSVPIFRFAYFKSTKLSMFTRNKGLVVMPKMYFYS